MSATRHRKISKTSLPENIATFTAPSTSLTVSWQDLPEWQKDNEYILNGYRRAQDNWRGCLVSVFAYLHNETINIHSHLWGAALFVYLLARSPSHVLSYANANWVDVVMMSIFYGSAVFCLTSSALFHTATCHSERVSARCHAFDYSGIVVLTVGSFHPSLYYAFFGEPILQAVYLIGINLVGIGAAYIVLNPDYAKPTHRGARTSVFIALGLSAVFPVTHCLFSHGFDKMLDEMGFGWLLASGAFYIGGALIYANRIPERFMPGKFDYFCASHQIFHFCVVIAAFLHHESVLKASNHWYSGNSSM